MDDETIEIRSFRAAFDLERRVYRIDRFRLNPGGVPIRGLVYCVAAMLAVQLAAAIPGLHGALALLPWYARDVALPAGVAALLAIVRVDGRPFHLAGLAILRFLLAPRRLSGLRPCACLAVRDGWRPPALVLLPDGSDSGLRRLRFRGRGAVLAAVAHELRATRALGSGAGRLVLRAPARSPGGGAHSRPHRGRVVELARGARLDVR